MASAFRSLSRRSDSWLFLGSVKFCCDVQYKCMSQIGINIDQGTAYLEFTETLKDGNANANVVKNLRSHSQLVPEMELRLALDSKCSSISTLPLTQKPFLGGKYEIVLFCILTAEKCSSNFGSSNCRSHFFPRPPNYLPWWTPVCARVHSCVRRFVTLWAGVCQAPLSMEFSRQKFRSRLPFSTPGDSPDSGTEPESLALAGRLFTLSHLGSGL